MITNLKPYPAYKDSGVEWLGKVPKHWEVVRLGALLRERNETNEKGEVKRVLSVLRGRGVVPYEEKGNVGNKKSDDITRYKIVYFGDIVLNSMNVIIGSVGISQYHGCLSPVYYVLTPHYRTDNPLYLNAYFQTKPFQQSLIRLGNGIQAHRMRIPMELLKSEPFPRPPAKEQADIAKLLDWANRRIRFIIAARKKRIQLLEEYQQTLINDAVTGKFDVRTGKPYPIYKDSGVEWLGKVPEKWQVVRFKRVARLAYGDPLPVDTRSEGLIRVFGSNGPVGHHNQANTQAPVIIVGRKGSFGKVQYSTQPVFAIDTTFYIDRRHTNANLRWLYYLLTQLGLDNSPKDSAIPGLDREDVYTQPIPLPSLTEQRAIAEYLDRETKKIDAAIEKTKKSIELWEELRTTLISDVVTGKYDVRELAEDLLEEEPELEAKIEILEASLKEKA